MQMGPPVYPIEPILLHGSPTSQSYISGDSQINNPLQMASIKMARLNTHLVSPPDVFYPHGPTRQGLASGIATPASGTFVPTDSLVDVMQNSNVAAFDPPSEAHLSIGAPLVGFGNSSKVAINPGFFTGTLQAYRHTKATLLPFKQAPYMHSGLRVDDNRLYLHTQYVPFQQCLVKAPNGFNDINSFGPVPIPPSCSFKNGFGQPGFGSLSQYQPNCQHAQMERTETQLVSAPPTTQSNSTPTVSDFGAALGRIQRASSSTCSEASTSDHLARNTPPVDLMESTKDGQIGEDLRQYYIQQSKLLPKVRGVWFNSTVRRMGWVGQAYKRCKRIEKIFSIAKHGFEGARELAIAFRNSQKPSSSTSISIFTGRRGGSKHTNGSIVPIVEKPCQVTRPEESALAIIKSPAIPTVTRRHTAVSSAPIECLPTIEEPSNEPTAKSDSTAASITVTTSDSSTQCDTARTKFSSFEPLIEDLDVLEEEQESFNVDECMEKIKKYKSCISREERIYRDALVKGSILFLLYELEALLELDIPVPPLTQNEAKKGIRHHIDVVDSATTNSCLMPYLDLLGSYIYQGIAATSIPHAELYTLVRSLSFCKPLSFEFKQPVKPGSLFCHQDVSPPDISQFLLYA